MGSALICPPPPPHLYVLPLRSLPSHAPLARSPPHAQAPDSARAALQRADVLLIGARRPDVVAAQWVRSGCVILDLGLASCSAPAPTAPRSPLVPGSRAGEAEQRDVLCLCCSDGLSAMTAALRMRNASHAALVQQGFLEQDKPASSPQPHSMHITNGHQLPVTNGHQLPAHITNGHQLPQAFNGAAMGKLDQCAPPSAPRPDWAA